jgi:hypothetical protein
MILGTAESLDRLNLGRLRMHGRRIHRRACREPRPHRGLVRSEPGPGKVLLRRSRIVPDGL